MQVQAGIVGHQSQASVSGINLGKIVSIFALKHIKLLCVFKKFYLKIKIKSVDPDVF